MKKYIAEFMGTAILVLFGCGSAITNGFGTGYVGIALAFGLALAAMVYCIGSISGCHINPAVSLAMFITKKIDAKDLLGYIIAQVLGAILGTALLVVIFGTGDGLGANTFGAGTDQGLNAMQAFIAEVILTFTFVLTVLSVSNKKEYQSLAGMINGLTLTLIHIMGISLTGTSVNPARSIGPALFLGGQPLEQLWLFILAPLCGAVLAAILFEFVLKPKSKIIE